MLKYKIEKKLIKQKKTNLSQFGLTHQIYDLIIKSG